MGSKEPRSGAENRDRTVRYEPSRASRTDPAAAYFAADSPQRRPHHCRSAARDPEPLAPREQLNSWLGFTPRRCAPRARSRPAAKSRRPTDTSPDPILAACCGRSPNGPPSGGPCRSAASTALATTSRGGVTKRNSKPLQAQGRPFHSSDGRFPRRSRKPGSPRGGLTTNLMASLREDSNGTCGEDRSGIDKRSLPGSQRT